MLIGQGEDGAATAVLGEVSYTRSWLQRRDGLATGVPDCTTADELTVWQAAPGAAVVLPERYTPTYAYPALIWLAEPGEDELAIRRWLQEISERNFVGIGLRPELYAPNATSSSELAARGDVSCRSGLARFQSLLQSIEPWVRLHPDRRYIAGSGQAARTAVKWLLTRPKAFAGAIAVRPQTSSSIAWRAAAPLGTARRVLWIEDRSADAASQADLVALKCLGLQVTAVTDSDTEPSTALAAKINRWVLSSIDTAILD